MTNEIERSIHTNFMLIVNTLTDIYNFTQYLIK